MGRGRRGELTRYDSQESFPEDKRGVGRGGRGRLKVG